MKIRFLLPLIFSEATLLWVAGARKQPAVVEPNPSRELNPDLGDVVPNIVGGSNAQLGEFPYYVYLKFIKPGIPGEFSACGGSLIAPDLILTAAHCTKDKETVAVLVGAINSFGSGAIAERNCDVMVEHPGYMPDLAGIAGFNNDYALCKLDQAVDVDLTSVYLELNREDSVPAAGQDLTVMGLGYVSAGYETYPNGTLVVGDDGGYVLDPTLTERAATLQAVTVPFVDRDACEAVMPINATANMMCAGALEGGRGTCMGDSGGPLFLPELQSDGRTMHRQVGVVSFGVVVNAALDENGCAITDRPGVFARVSAQWDWIRQTACADLGSVAGFCTFSHGSSSKSSKKSTKKSKKSKKRGNRKQNRTGVTRKVRRVI